MRRMRIYSGAFKANYEVLNLLSMIFLHKKTATPDFSRIAEYSFTYMVLNQCLFNNRSNTS